MQNAGGIFVGSVAIGLLTLATSSASGQGQRAPTARRAPTVSSVDQVISRSKTTGGERFGSARIPSIARPSTQKPFSNIQPRSTVSPYLNLTLDEAAGGVAVPTYQSIVRPQLEQQRFNQQQQRQVSQLQSQLNSLHNAGGVPITGSRQVRPTGHSTGFMNMSHYFGR